MINKGEINIIADVNVTMIANVINHVMLENM